MIEHVPDVVALVTELYRIARPGGRLKFVAPHYSNPDFATDPTHRNHLNSYSFNCFMEERQLFPGDSLILYTDGVTESFHEDQEQFGEERLIEALQRHRELAARELLGAVIEEVQRFSPHEQQDDITLIAAKCREGFR